MIHAPSIMCIIRVSDPAARDPALLFFPSVPSGNNPEEPAPKEYRGITESKRDVSERKLALFRHPQ
jgi:hypothetical protein